MRDRDGDGLADRFECVSDAFGFGGEHEYTFGSKFDRNGDIWLVLCLTGSYTSKHPFRGWVPARHPRRQNDPGVQRLAEPGWHRRVRRRDVLHREPRPLERLLFDQATQVRRLSRAPRLEQVVRTRTASRTARRTHRRQGRATARGLEAHPSDHSAAAVWLPYKKMGQSASAIVVDRSEGRFGPFAGQLFVPDYTLSLVSRVFLEKIDGVYQGACFPFRKGFKTGLLGAFLHKKWQADRRRLQPRLAHSRHCALRTRTHHVERQDPLRGPAHADSSARLPADLYRGRSTQRPLHASTPTG